MFGPVKQLIEVPIICSVFSIALQISVYTNLVIYRTCYVTLGYNQSECALLGSLHKDNLTEKLEKTVEPDANIISLWLQMPAGFVCAFVALYMGSWSDRNGRKPVLVFTTGSLAISTAMVAVFCMFPGLSAWYILTSSVPVLFTGGFAALLSVFLSYITDITDEYSRGTRLGIFEMVFALGGLLGTFCSSYIFEMIGYTGIFSVSAAIMFFATLFVIFLMEESLPENQLRNGESQLSFMAEIKCMFRLTFKKRRHYDRSLILLCVTITSVFIFAFLSDIGINYMFLRLKFDWSLEKFNIFSSSRDLISIFGTLFGIYGLHQVLRMPETVLIIVGLISCMNGTLVQGFATNDFDIYFAGVLRLLSGCVNPMTRSLISKLAEPDEIGGIFSVSVMCQSILQLVGSPIYTEIYNKSLSTWPSFYNFITAGIYFFLIGLTIIVMILLNKTSDYINLRLIVDEHDLPFHVNSACKDDDRPFEFETDSE